MARPVVEPTVTRGKWGADDREVLTHPAYAQVSISHVSGSSDLYGSDFTHQNYVTLSISRSELHRDLNRDWYFEREELIEIALSEAQYATMVAAPRIIAGRNCLEPAAWRAAGWTYRALGRP